MLQTYLPKVETLTTVQRGETWRCDTARSLDHPILFWITRGQGRFMVNCRMRGVGPYSAIYIPEKTLFSYEMFAQSQGMVLYMALDEAAGLPEEGAVIKVSNAQAQSEMTGLIDGLTRELSEMRPGRQRALRANAMLVGVWLDRLLSDKPQSKLGKSDKVLREFSHVVSINKNNGKSIGEFAADLDVTPTHLTRLTQGAVGKPASAIVQESVIHAACDALIHSDQPVQDIAKSLGFNSPAYFTRAFQTHTGCSPSAFRKERRPH